MNILFDNSYINGITFTSVNGIFGNIIQEGGGVVFNVTLNNISAIS
jgi:hypothetical protein